MNNQQIIKNIAHHIRGKENKINQLKAVQEISMLCTSDDHINITCEMLPDGIVRYLISGTRSGMTLTVDTRKNEITRKPRGAAPWYTCKAECWCSDILKRI